MFEKIVHIFGGCWILGAAKNFFREKLNLKTASPRVQWGQNYEKKRILKLYKGTFLKFGFQILGTHWEIDVFLMLKFKKSQCFTPKVGGGLYRISFPGSTIVLDVDGK